jgi:D-alanine-D-alanine ligase
MKTISVKQTSNNSEYQLDFPVVVLYNKASQYIKGEKHDRIADEGVVVCAKTIVGALQAMGIQVVDLPFDKDVESVLKPYPPNKSGVFNLGEGLAGKFFEEARIAWALESMGYAFTGSSGDAIALSLNKALAKSRLHAAGLHTPEWWLFTRPDEVTAETAELIEYPVIVKPIAEDGSIGLGSSAVVHKPSRLRDQVAYVNERYYQCALVERFIVGRELNISLLGNTPEVLPIAEIDFSDFSDPYKKIVSFEAKWEEDSFEYNHTPSICPADLPPRIATRVKQAALRAWQIIGCSGYARVDMRLDENNIPYIVEVNCNPDLSSNAGFHIAARTAGYTYKKMIIHILKNAWRRSDDYRQTGTKRTRSKNKPNFRKNNGV